MSGRNVEGLAARKTDRFFFTLLFYRLASENLAFELLVTYYTGTFSTVQILSASILLVCSETRPQPQRHQLQPHPSRFFFTYASQNFVCPSIIGVLQAVFSFFFSSSMYLKACCAHTIFFSYFFNYFGRMIFCPWWPSGLDWVGWVGQPAVRDY